MCLKIQPRIFFLIIVFLLERRCFRTFYFFFSCSVIFSLRENVSRCETTLREVESSPEITKRRFCYKKKGGKNKQQVWRTSSKVNLLIIALWSRRRRRVKVVVVKRGQKGHRMDDLSGLTQKRQVTEDHLLQIFTPDSAESKLTLTHSSNLLCLSELELQNRLWSRCVCRGVFFFSSPHTDLKELRISSETARVVPRTFRWSPSWKTWCLRGRVSSRSWW